MSVLACCAVHLCDGHRQSQRELQLPGRKLCFLHPHAINHPSLACSAANPSPSFGQRRRCHTLHYLCNVPGSLLWEKRDNIHSYNAARRSLQRPLRWNCVVLGCWCICPCFYAGFYRLLGTILGLQQLPAVTSVRSPMLSAVFTVIQFVDLK
jgi:hypothetical protein